MSVWRCPFRLGVKPHDIRIQLIPMGFVPLKDHNLDFKLVTIVHRAKREGHVIWCLGVLSVNWATAFRAKAFGHFRPAGGGVAVLCYVTRQADLRDREHSTSAMPGTAGASAFLTVASCDNNR